MADEQEFVVTLPINGVQADIAGMPAEWLERAVRAVGRPFDALASRPSAIVEEPIVADESIDHHAYRVAHIPEPSRSPQPHTGRAGVTEEMVNAGAQFVDPSGIFNLTWQECQERSAAVLNAALTVEPEAPDNAFAEYEGVPAKELAETVARYGKALKEISSPTQTEGLLWWQIKAREALAGVEPEAGEVKPGWVLVPEDLLTHLGDWESACLIAKEAAPNITIDLNDASYWQHQLDTIARIRSAIAP